MIVMTVDLGGTITKIGLIRDGEILATRQFPAQSIGSLKSYLPVIERQLKQLLQERQWTIDACHGLGIISTGFVDRRTNRVLSTNRKYDDAVEIDFNAWARETFGLPLKMENDAHAALLGEWFYGAALGYQNVVMLTLGTGIGSSVIMGGRPLRGRSNKAGLLGGHMVINPDGRLSNSPTRGSVEAEASSWALPSLAREHPLYPTSSLRDIKNLDYAALFEVADAGDILARELEDHSLKIWGSAVVSMVNLFDPEIVVIGGGLMNAASRILPAIQQRIDQYAWTAGDKIQVLKARYPGHAGILGISATFAREIEYI